MTIVPTYSISPVPGDPHVAGPQARELRGIWHRFGGFHSDVAVGTTRRLYWTELRLHAVEAPVRVAQHTGVEPLLLLAMRALSLAETPDATGTDLLLCLGCQMTRQILFDLTRRGNLVEKDGQFTITAGGQETLRTGQETHTSVERRVFYFLDPSLHFVSLRKKGAEWLRTLSPAQTGNAWHFDRQALERCITESPAWKQSRGFSPDVVGIESGLGEGSRGLTAQIGPNDLERSPLWVDKACHASLILVAEENASKLMRLDAQAPFRSNAPPIFSLLGDAIEEAFPSVREDPTTEAIDAAWDSVATEWKLQQPKRVRAAFAQGRLVCTLQLDLMDEWATFCEAIYSKEVFGAVEIESLWLVCPVTIEPADHEAEKQWERLRLLFELEANLADVALDDGQLWPLLRAHAVAGFGSRAELAAYVWNSRKYALAYRLTQPEDMTDAAF